VIGRAAATRLTQTFSEYHFQPIVTVTLFFSTPPRARTPALKNGVFESIFRDWIFQCTTDVRFNAQKTLNTMAVRHAVQKFHARQEFNSTYCLYSSLHIHAAPNPRFGHSSFPHVPTVSPGPVFFNRSPRLVCHRIDAVSCRALSENQPIARLS